MTDRLIEEIKRSLEFYEKAKAKRGPMRFAKTVLYDAARMLFPEVIEKIEELQKDNEELRAAINGKTFTVLSDDGEAWKARAEAAEKKLAKMA